MTEYELHYESALHGAGNVEIPDEAEHVEVFYSPDNLGEAKVCFLLPAE